jgi:antitoxin component YwqK of YwqJK toxin-antitoxin module
MKMTRSSCFFMLLVLMTSCQNNCYESDEVICETVHRYGVPLEPQDWSQRGQNGQVISMRKDGVTLCRTYDAGVLHGDCTYTFPHRDIVQKKEVYDQGSLVQDFSYYSNGLPWQHTTYDSPNCQSSLIWYENGAPQSREQFENGSLVQGEYYNYSHQLESRVDGSSGTRTRRDGLGQLQSMDSIQEGQMVLRTSYHPNGNPADVTPYVDGVIEGQRRTFMAGGEPASVEEWSNNVQHGTTVVFEQGEKWADVPYVEGQKHGVERHYRDGQTVVQEIPWVQGQRHGQSHTTIGHTTQEEWHFRDRQIPNRATFEMLSNQ